MQYRIGIDVGGTFTDVVVQGPEGLVRAKADSTPYNLTVGVQRAATLAADALGMTYDGLVRQAETVVYSTTVGTNALIERKGPRLGLITTTGFEDTLWLGRGRNWADGLSPEQRRDRGRARRPSPLIPRELIVGLHERLDPAGNILMPLREEEVVDKVRYLVDQGVRGFVVVLLYSYVNPVHEHMVADVIRKEYPETYLGHMPVYLSSQVAPQMGEYRRTVTTILDAYLRELTENHLLDLSDHLRELNYQGPVLLAKCTGGVSSPSRTRPIELYGSGPVASIVSASELSRWLGAPNLLVTDMGGTSFDVGIVVEGTPLQYDYDPLIERWRVQLPVVPHWSIGAGGGSIAQVVDGRPKVGPQSAGANPGPACYRRGGTAPTVTDADLVLGYLNPEFFLGGRLPLDPTSAEAAIANHVAKPLGLTVEEAAWAVKSLVDGTMGQEIYRITALNSGYDPREFTLLCLGGAGPVHVTGYSGYADVRQAVVLPIGSVGGAFGTLALDVLQTYEKTVHQVIFRPDFERIEGDAMTNLNAQIEELVQLARRDLEEERFVAGEMAMSLDILLRFGQQRHFLPITAGSLGFREEGELQKVASEFVRLYAATYGEESTFVDAGIEVIGLRLHARKVLPKPVITVSPSRDRSRSLPPRRAYWGPGVGWISTPVWYGPALEAETVVQGPALVEYPDTVVVVSPGWQLSVTENGAGWLQHLGRR
ncbi:MAG: hydantoinase/oxoprolinase family protein [Firmicutes bacterium]|nr:hydantoinase/oxoprolinase family protein [Bacillota bacterium]